MTKQKVYAVKAMIAGKVTWMAIDEYQTCLLNKGPVVGFKCKDVELPKLKLSR
jgi:hypothetical protein